MCGLDLALHPYCSVTLAKPVTGHAPSAGAGALAHGQGIGVTVEREQNDTWWTPRADQWLRLCTSNIGDMDSIPGQGTKIPHAAKKKKEETWILSRSYPRHLSFILGLFVPESLFSAPHRPPFWYSLRRASPNTILFFLSPGQLQAKQAIETKYQFVFFSPGSFLLEVP